MKEPYTSFNKIAVHFGVMDHFAEKKDASAWVLFNRPESDLDCVLNAITKPEMPRNVILHRPEIEHCWTVVLLPGILDFPELLDLRNDGTPVKLGDVEGFHA